MTDLAAIHAVQQSILRTVSANGEVLQAILEEITKPQQPSEVAEALIRMAQAVEANTAATERLVDERINAVRMTAGGKLAGHDRGQQT